MKLVDSLPTEVTFLRAYTILENQAGGVQLPCNAASDGSVWAWGSGQFGELGPASSSAVNATAVPVVGLSGVVEQGTFIPSVIDCDSWISKSWMAPLLSR